MARLFLLLHHFTFHFWNGLKLSFCHFTSSLFSIRAFLIFLPLQMESINYLTKREFSYLFGFLLFGCIFVLFFYIPSSYQISALREFWGAASYFIVFSISSRISLIHDTISVLGKEKSLNEDALFISLYFAFS